MTQSREGTIPKPISTVLVADNNPVLRSFMVEILEPAGYTVMTAESGVAALEVVKEWVPDVFFVDRVMPEIDGDELCRILRAKPETKNAFLVVLSAIAVEDPKVPVLDLVDACLAKTPFAELRQSVLKVLEDLSAGRTQQYRGRVVGADNLFKREVTAELLEANRHLAAFFQASPNGVLELNANGVIVLANANARRLLGGINGELVSHPFTAVLQSEDLRERVTAALAQVSERAQNLGEYGEVEINGRRVMITLVSIDSARLSSVLVLLQDITELYESRRRAETLLKEKETLLREVQHRVKNNLTTISGLLQLQAGSGVSNEVSEALGEAEGRVRSVLKIYDILFATGDYRAVDLCAFLRELCRGLASLYRPPKGRVQCDIGHETITVPVETAIPVGLIVNELVTNAYKYAFEGRGGGTVTVSLFREHDGVITLRVADDGRGLPDAVYNGSEQGFGLELVQAEVDQINACLRVERNSGTVFTIRL